MSEEKCRREEAERAAWEAKTDGAHLHTELVQTTVKNVDLENRVQRESEKKKNAEIAL